MKHAFPQTRYQGSKAKLLDWIWYQMADLDFNTCLDVFGGTGAVAYRLKQERKQVTYNDYLRFNHLMASALIENSTETLSDEDVEWLVSEHGEIKYTDLVERIFPDIYFTNEENRWIDQTLSNMRHLDGAYKFEIAFFALAQACIIKRPYNLFHRKNLYVRMADVERSFGNKITWDRPFEDYFKKFAQEANSAVFSNGYSHNAFNFDAFEVPGNYDLVYIDTPYIAKSGTGVDYRDFYHFLEGMTKYDEWESSIDVASKHKRLLPFENVWNDKNKITDGFERLFQKFQDSIIVVSYRSDGIPSEIALMQLLKKYKQSVTVHHFGTYKYVLSRNNESKEVLLIGT
ncbi:DNA adenine methylase [Candidatus Peregrinibacteria bacterium]|nr:DNA adenine methylase [Candidatus Peregrinibacteria bacterium]MBI3816252.1 DNA adenine methylase [Candidatus Peregrinibacteria bacterium]